MKRSLLIATLLLSVPFAQASTPGPFERDCQVLRLNAMIDPEVEDDDTALNYELAFGVAMYPFSEVGVLVGHMDSGFCDTTETLLYVEDTYDVGLPVLPYASLGVGYLWARQDDGDEVDSLFGEIEGGLKYMVTEHHSLGVGVEYSYSQRDAYMDKNGQSDDHNLEFGLSLSYYY